MYRLQHFITPTDGPPFPEVSHGRGVYIFDKEGRRYIDASSGAVASNLGHDNARVKAAIHEQADRISFAYGRVWESEVHRRLTAKLADMSGMGLDSVFLVSGGTEAVEAAIKIARQAAVGRGEAGRWKVISRTPSYHGSTLAILGVTGDEVFAGPFRPMFVPMPKVPAPLSYRPPGNLSADDFARDCAAALEAEILSQGPESVLAFIMEPVGGTSTGALVAPDHYYAQVREICDRHGVFLIFDEVMSGAGRTGKFLAAHHWPAARPDIVALAKGVSGGYAPLGAVLTRAELVDTLRAQGGLLHGHTYAANPMACAVGCAVLEEIESRQLIANAAAAGERLRRGLEGLKAQIPIVGDVRGLGLLLAVEIVADPVTKAMFPEATSAISRIRACCQEEGVMVLSRRTSGGRYGEWLMVSPPLIITQAEVDDLVARLGAGLLRFQGEMAMSAARCS